jgi:hypothetical protein
VPARRQLPDGSLLNPVLKEKLRNDSPRLPKIKIFGPATKFVKDVNATRSGVLFQSYVQYFHTTHDSGGGRGMFKAVLGHVGTL